MTTTQIEKQATQRARYYKQEITELERPLKSEEDILATKYVQISVASENCYKSFNDLQMTIAVMKNKTSQTKFQVDCYHNTYDFLAFVQNEIDTDFCIDLLKESEPFRRLFNHYSKYCTEIEKKYDIELHSEKLLRVNSDFMRVVKDLTQ